MSDQALSMRGRGRATRDSSSFNKFYLGFPNRGRRSFSCLSKRKYAKRRTPRQGADGPLRFSGLGPSPSHSTSLYCVSGADSLSAPLTGFTPNPAMLGAAPYGDPTTAPTVHSAVVGFSVAVAVQSP